MDPLSGRLGNQLFQFNFGLQIARSIGVQFNLSNNDVFEMCTIPNHFSKRLYLRPRKVQTLDKSSILRHKADFIYESCLKIIESGKTVSLPSGILGEVFFKFFAVNPRDVFIPRMEFSKIENINQDFRNRVALHFRGSDFASWRPSYVMDYDFYIRAIRFMNVSSKEVDLFTDDPEHPTVVRLISDGVVDNVVSSSNGFRDFWTMSNYGSLVISPSTFAVWASMLGKAEKIVYNKNWYARDGIKEIFWQNYVNNLFEITGNLVGV